MSSIFVRFALIGLLGNLPIAFVAYKFVAIELEQVSIAHQERAGISYLPTVWAMYDAAVAGRDATAEQVAAVNTAGARHDAVLGTAFYRERFLEASSEGGAAAIEAGGNFLRRIVDYSNLAADDDLSNYQAIDIIASALPEMADSALILLEDLALAGDDFGHQAALDRFDRASAQLYESLGAADALNFTTELTARLGAAQTELYAAINRLSSVAMATPIGAGLTGDAEISDRHSAFQAALSDYWYAAASAIEALVVNRIELLQSHLRRDIAIAIGVYLIVAALIWSLARSIRNRARTLLRAVDRMRAGDLDDAPENTDHYDELGDLARAFDVFRKGLLEKRAADEAIRRQNHRLTEQQAELEIKNLRFNVTLNNMRHGLAMFDQDHRLAVWNDRFAEIYAVPATALVPGTPYN